MRLVYVIYDDLSLKWKYFQKDLDALQFIESFKNEDDKRNCKVFNDNDLKKNEEIENLKFYDTGCYIILEIEKINSLDEINETIRCFSSYCLRKYTNEKSIGWIDFINSGSNYPEFKLRTLGRNWENSLNQLMQSIAIFEKNGFPCDYVKEAMREPWSFHFGKKEIVIYEPTLPQDLFINEKYV